MKKIETDVSKMLIIVLYFIFVTPINPAIHSKVFLYPYYIEGKE